MQRSRVSTAVDTERGETRTWTPGTRHPNGNGAGIAADPTLTGVWVPKNALRLAFRCSPKGGGYVARRSRRCRFRRGPSMIRRPFPCRPAVPRPILLARPLMVRTMRGIAVLSKPAGKSGLPTARLRGFNGLEVAASEDALAFIPPPCGISPSRREWFQNLFFFQGVTPSIRRANPRSRCLENAPPGRVGQGQTGRLIHFRRDCQWTRVDKSTVRREREIFPVRP